MKSTRKQTKRGQIDHLEDGGRGGDHGEGGVNTAGGVGGERGLDQLPLELVCRGRGRLEVAGELLCAPVGAGASAHECEHPHPIRDVGHLTLAASRPLARPIQRIAGTLPPSLLFIARRIYP